MSFLYKNFTRVIMATKDRKWYAPVETLINKFNALRTRRSTRYGIPFLIFVLGGSVGLSKWTQIRYEFSKNKGISNEEAEKMGLKKTKDVTLEGVYDEIKDLDIDNWDNVRVPRPWDENLDASSK